MKRLGAAALLCTLVLAVASVAAAHEGDGRLEVLQATPGQGMAVDYQVKLTYVADGHGAPDATVTAVAEQPGAAAAAPVQLSAGAEEGVYAGTVTFPGPGDWTVRFTSVTPAATLEQPQAVTAPATTTTPSTTSTTVATTAGADEVAAESSEDDGSGFPVVPVVAVVLVIAAVGLGAWAMSARRRSATT